MNRVKQFVMAYRASHKEIKELLPAGFVSLRPVLRINVEEVNEWFHRVEFNTPASLDGISGWLNLHTWESSREAPDMFCAGEYIGEDGKLSIQEIRGDVFRIDLTLSDNKMAETVLTMVFTLTGKAGGCPKENDNQGTFYKGGEFFAEAEEILESKEYAECDFFWNVPVREIKLCHESSEKNMMLRNAMHMDPMEVLGAYVVEFERE